MNYSTVAPVYTLNTHTHLGLHLATLKVPRGLASFKHALKSPYFRLLLGSRQARAHISQHTHTHTHTHTLTDYIKALIKVSG